MTSPFRVALVGTGGISRAHARACSLTDNARLVAVCDVSQEAIHRFSAQFDVEKTYLRLEDMLASEEIDIAVICTWGAFHADVGIRIAESRKVRAILCEKPFTQISADAERLVAAATAHDVLVVEAFKFRHHPMHLKAKELAEEGAVGELKVLRSTFCTASSKSKERTPDKNWRWNKAKGGGAIYDLGCYNIHYARWIFESEPVEVYATARWGIEVEDAATIQLLFPNHGVAQIAVGFDTWSSQEVEIHGTTGSIFVDRAWNNEDRAVSLERRSFEKIERYEFEPVFQFQLQLEHLCDCLSCGCPHRISPLNSVAQMRVVDSVFESIRTGRAVEV